jgi:hypothetical protein
MGRDEWMIRVVCLNPGRGAIKQTREMTGRGAWRGRMHAPGVPLPFSRNRPLATARAVTLGSR